MTISIVGRTNVGKSSVFNRLVKKRHSVVFDTPHVTRDSISSWVEIGGIGVRLIDTGGYEQDKTDFFGNEINESLIRSIKESDLVFLVVSKPDGLLPEDWNIYRVLVKLIKKERILLLVNKADVKGSSVDFWQLGLSNLLDISAEHGLGMEDLVSWVMKSHEDLKFKNTKIPKPKLKISVVGRRNVGKSTLANAISLKSSNIISSRLGSTRDAVDIPFSVGDIDYLLIDSPGISRSQDALERCSVLKAKKALIRSDLVLLIVESEINALDKNIAGLINKSFLPAVIVMNKWDLEDKSSVTRVVIEKKIRKELQFLHFAPIVFISAKFGTKLGTIFKSVDLICSELSREVAQENLDRFLLKIQSLFSKPTVKGRKVKLFKMTQVKGRNPTFVVLCNSTDYLHFSYERMIENQFREAFGFFYCPLTFFFKSK